MLSTWFEITLWKRILAALLLGLVVGAIWGEGAESISWMGDLFVRLIRMVVVPLVFVTLVAGVVAMGDPSKLGSLGIRTLALYMATTLAAISIGLFLATVLQPGAGIDLSGATPDEIQEAIPLSERLLTIVPENPFQALAEGNILAIIFFSLLVGVGVLTVGERARPIADFMDAGMEVMLKMTHWVMELAPFGVFALIATVAGTQGAAALLDVIRLAAAVAIGCLVHVTVVHGSIMRFVLKLSPVSFFPWCPRCHVAGLFHFQQFRDSANVHVSRGRESGRQTGRCFNRVATGRHYQYGWIGALCGNRDAFCNTSIRLGSNHCGLRHHRRCDNSRLHRDGSCARCLIISFRGRHGCCWNIPGADCAGNRIHSAG